MKKTQDVIGLPVLDLSSGKKVGVVKDVYFDQDADIVGLAVETNGLFNRHHYLSFNHIGVIGDDAITIGAERFLTSIPEHEYYAFQTGKKMYKGLPVITTNGKELGHIEDVYILEEMGRIIGYELSDGFFSDMTEGRKNIQQPRKVILGEDAMIIPRDQIQEINVDGVM